MNPSIRTLIFPAALALGASWYLSACNDDDDDSDSGSARFDQADRMGLPGVNTIFNHPSSVEGFSKILYNRRSPDSDLVNYKDQFVTVLGAVSNGAPEATAAALLPDELPAKLGSAASDFALLDGRKLEDDAIDIALGLLVGSDLPALQSDHVDANDTAFSAEFPYLAGPH